MRIIAGEAKNTRLRCPEGDEVRPLLSAVREALFNIYRQATPGAEVLDLYAGCGAIGLEALSRGAAWCVFVERSAKARAALEANLDQARLAGRGDVLPGDACACLPRLKRLGRAFKLVFVDPPYPLWASAPERSRIVEFLDSLADAGLLAPRPWITVHHVPGSPAPSATRNFVLDEQRQYGRSLISIYAPKKADSPAPSESTGQPQREGRTQDGQGAGYQV